MSPFLLLFCLFFLWSFCWNTWYNVYSRHFAPCSLHPIMTNTQTLKTFDSCSLQSKTRFCNWIWRNTIWSSRLDDGKKQRRRNNSPSDQFLSASDRPVQVLRSIPGSTNGCWVVLTCGPQKQKHTRHKMVKSCANYRHLFSRHQPPLRLSSGGQQMYRLLFLIVVIHYTL